MKIGILGAGGIAVQMAKTVAGMKIMMGMRGCNVNQIHLWICKHFLIRAISLGKTIFLGKGLRPFKASGCHCVILHILHSSYRIALATSPYGKVS